MALPELIEIVPPGGAVKSEITVPGSKSITNRALVLGALARGKTLLRGALWSEDTQVMVQALQTLGFSVQVEADPAETGNRTILIEGKSGWVPKGGTKARPLELFVANAGTAARFLAALVALGQGVYRLHGAPRMHERPQAELFIALRQLGCEVRPENKDERLPVQIRGARRAHPRLPSAVTADRWCSVSMQSSSQFASALLLCASAAGWKVRVVGENPDQAPYVAMTREMVRAFPQDGGVFQVEPDCSSGSYFLAFGNSVSVANWPSSGWQIDQQFPRVLARMVDPAYGLESGQTQQEQVPVISRKRDLGDSIMLLIVLAALGSRPVRFTDLGRLRVQECERVAALRTELTRCGAKVVEEDETLTVYPSTLHGAEIETYGDHRMAMCFAILGLKVPGVRIKDPACVKKTFPNFFQKLAGPGPAGLGASVRDVATGRSLGAEDLFAG